jgi:DNA-binding response OmpR family regulator
LALRILVVDDEGAILELIKTALSLDGHSIVTASSLIRARNCLEKGKFDLFIVDIGLTDGNGLDLVKAIRADNSGWVIILSGRGDLADRVIGLELGADDYIMKPFHIRELQARVRVVQRRLETSGEQALSTITSTRNFCDYVVDSAKRSVKKSGSPELHLTTREFDVLWALIENKNTVLTREAILLAAFGNGHEVGGRPVDGLILRLREKLFPDGTGAQRIKTIHGRGYQVSDY